MAPPSKIYYFFNPFYESSPEQWDLKIPFTAYPGMPNEDFFHTLEKDSVVIIDDQFNECIRNPGKTVISNKF